MSDSNKGAIAAEQFKRGSAAVSSGSWDYAIEMFLKCCKLVPERLTYRQALRAAEYRKYNDNKKGATMARMYMVKARAAASIAKTRKRWTDLMEAAEDALTYNPWDAGALYDLALGAVEMNFTDTALWAGESAAAVDKESAELYRLLARIYEQSNQFNKSINAWQMVKKLDPRDEDAGRRANQLAASETIMRGGYEQKEGFKVGQVISPTGGPVAQRDDSPEGRTRREIESLEARLASDPSSAGIYAQLGDLHRKLGEFTTAIDYYQKGLDASGGGDFETRLRLLDCQIDPVRKRIDEIQTEFNGLSRTDPKSAELARKLKQEHTSLQSELIKREIEFFRYRTQVKPEDYTAHYELGYRLLRLDQLDDAIRALQQGRNDTRLRWEALCWLGVAFWKKRNIALAEKNLSDARGAVPDGNEEAFKKVVYYQACVAQEKGETSRAVDYFNEIAAMDFGYKDVAKRLEALTGV